MGAVSRQIGPQKTATIIFGANRVGSTIKNRFLFAGYSDHTAEVIAHQALSPLSGFIRNFRVIQNIPSGNGNSITYRIRVNDAVTTLVVTLASTATSGANTSTTVPVSAGDRIDVRVEKSSGIAASPRNVVAVVEVS